MPVSWMATHVFIYEVCIALASDLEVALQDVCAGKDDQDSKGWLEKGGRLTRRLHHRENGGTLGMVPVRINPIYALFILIW